MVRGDVRLRLPVVEGVERGAAVGRVVAEAVGVGDGRRECLPERVGLRHLQPDAPHRRLPGELADQPAEPGAGADHDEVAVVALAAVVEDAGGRQRADLAARPPGVAPASLEFGAQGGLGDAGLDGGVARAPERAEEVAAQGRVERADLFGRQELEASLGRFGAFGHFARDGEFGVGADEGQGAVGAEPDPEHALADAPPQLPRSLRGVELDARGPAADPDQAEVAQGRAAGLGFTFELDDFVAAFDGLPGVQRAEHAAAYDEDSHASHAVGSASIQAVPMANGA